MASFPRRPRFEYPPGAPSTTVRAAVVVLNGAPVEALEAATRLLPETEAGATLVAVDGGLGTCLAGGRPPDLFVGDGDSWTGETPDCEVVRYDRDKDYSDLAGTLEVLAPRVDWIAVAGLTGGRLDHEWGNLFELGAHAGRFAAIVAPDSRGPVAVTARGCRANLKPGETFSLFALNGPAIVSLSGSRWELKRHRLAPGSRGLSNVAEGPLDLTVYDGVALCVVSSSV